MSTVTIAVSTVIVEGGEEELSAALEVLRLYRIPVSRVYMSTPTPAESL